MSSVYLRKPLKDPVCLHYIVRASWGIIKVLNMFTCNHYKQHDNNDLGIWAYKIKKIECALESTADYLHFVCLQSKIKNKQNTVSWMLINTGPAHTNTNVFLSFSLFCNVFVVFFFFSVLSSAHIKVVLWLLWHAHVSVFKSFLWFFVDRDIFENTVGG